MIKLKAEEGSLNDRKFSRKRTIDNGSQRFDNKTPRLSFSSSMNHPNTNFTPTSVPNASIMSGQNRSGEYAANQAYSQPQTVNSLVQPSYVPILPSGQQQPMTGYTPVVQPFVPQQPIPSTPIIQPQLIAPYQPAPTQVANVQPPEYSAQWIQFYRDSGLHDQV